MALSDEVLVVCAGNFNEFHDWRRAQDKRPGADAIYAVNATSVRGRRIRERIAIGTFWRRGDAGKIWEVIEMALAGRAK